MPTSWQPGGIFWRAKIIKRADLVVSPSLSAAALGLPGSVALSVVPSLTVAGSGRSTADAELAVSPGLGAFTPRPIPAGAELAVAPSLSALAAVRYPAQAGLVVTPGLGVAGGPASTGVVNLGVTPGLAAVGVGKSGAPQFSAVGGGVDVGSASGSFTMTAAAGDTVLCFFYTIQNSTPSVAVSFGDTAMTSAAPVTMFKNGSFDNYMTAFKLVVPARLAGTPQTVNVSAAGGTVAHIMANAEAYSGVGTVGTPQIVTGSGTSLSQSVNSAVGQRVAQAFFSGAATMSNYNQSQRWADPTTKVMVIGDAPGAPTVNFTATAGNDAWGGIAVPLLP